MLGRNIKDLIGKPDMKPKVPMGAGNTLLKIGKMFFWPLWCLWLNLFHICDLWHSS